MFAFISTVRKKSPMLCWGRESQNGWRCWTAGTSGWPKNTKRSGLRSFFAFRMCCAVFGKLTYLLLQQFWKGKRKRNKIFSRNLAGKAWNETIKRLSSKTESVCVDWQVKERCQKGIPPSLRGRAWLYLTGGKVKREQNQGRFQVRWVSVVPAMKTLSNLFEHTSDTWAEFLLFRIMKGSKAEKCSGKSTVVTENFILGTGRSTWGSKMDWHHRERPPSTVPFPWNVCSQRRSWVSTATLDAYH